LICIAATPKTPPDLRKFLGTRWYGIYLMDKKIGYAEGEISRGYYKGKDAALVGLKINTKVAMAGEPQEMEINERRTYVLGEGLAAFRNDTDSGGGKIEISGEVKGGKMEVVSRIGGQVVKTSLAAPEERFEDYIAEEALVKKGAKAGDEVTSSQYQPSLQKTLTAVSRVKEIQDRYMKGVLTRVYVVETTIKEMGVVTTSVLNEDGEVIQTQVAGAFTMRLEDEKTAKNLDYRSDVVLSTAVRSEKKIVNPFAVKEMKAVVSGVRDKTLLVNSDRQTYKDMPGGGESLTVKVENLAGVKIPDVPLNRGEFPEELKPGLFIQSDNPLIVAKARSIIGDRRNAREVSDAIVDWVYKNLKKRFSASFSNALDVLASGEGDCTEHSVLYVALARAAGLPAREVSGLVYCGDDGGFYYHQWAEAFVGKWIAVDPTFGQPQADATHIKFASGDLASQAKLLNLIGALKIEVREYGYGEKN